MWIMLPCFVLEQSLNVVLVVNRFDCVRGSTWLMSVKSSKQVYIIESCFEKAFFLNIDGQKR
jgi:hypothetical protein